MALQGNVERLTKRIDEISKPKSKLTEESYEYEQLTL
jgi:hypothetical protein